MAPVAAELPAGIDRRPSGGYRARAAHGGRHASRTFGTLAAAVRWRAEALDRLRAGEEAPSAPAPAPALAAAATVEDACRTFGAGIRAGTVRTRSGGLYKPSQSRRMESALRVHALPRVGHVPVGALTRRMLQGLVDDLAAAHGPETARKALHALAAVLRVAERDGLVEANPARGVRVPTADHDERPVRVLTPEECDALVAAAEADDARLGRSLAAPLVALALGSGLRLGELLALRWGADGLDLDAAVVHVRASLDRARDVDGAFPVVTPKTRAGWRDVPLDPADVARMRRHRLATGRRPAGGLVFADADGAPLDAGGAPRRSWERVARAAGIAAPVPTFHHLRHAWAVAMLRAGVRPEALARLGGWSSVAMVHARYGRHALPDETAEAGRMLAAWRAARRGSA
jgi:integrase